MSTLNDLNNTILESTPSDWIVEHDGRPAVYKNDLLLTIKTVNTKESFNEPWAVKHPNPNAKQSMAEIYYGNNVIIDVHLANIDGGRALMPYPDSETHTQISNFDYKIGCILNGQEDMDNYMQRCKFTVAD